MKVSPITKIGPLGAGTSKAMKAGAQNSIVYPLPGSYKNLVNSVSSDLIT
jgi:hypothetical protein